MKYHKRVDELICKWSMATGHAFSELHLNSLVDMLGDEMQAENAKLREALEYYAHPDHYEERITMAEVRPPGVIADGGHKARQALSGDGK